MDEKEELERLRAENAELKAMLEEATSPGAPGIGPAETVFTEEPEEAVSLTGKQKPSEKGEKTWL